MMRLGSADIFALQQPQHPLTAALHEVAGRLVSGGVVALGA